MGQDGISSCKLVMTELTVAGRRLQAVTVKSKKWSRHTKDHLTHPKPRYSNLASWKPLPVESRETILCVEWCGFSVSRNGSGGHTVSHGEIVGTPNSGAESNSGRQNNKSLLKQLSIAPTVKLKWIKAQMCEGRNSCATKQFSYLTIYKFYFRIYKAHTQARWATTGKTAEQYQSSCVASPGWSCKVHSLNH